MAIAQVTAGNRIVTSDLNAFYNLLKGVSGSGETLTLIYNNEALIFQPSSDPTAGTRVWTIKNNAGTVLASMRYDGLLKLLAAAADPATAVVGSLYFDTLVTMLKVYDGTNWTYPADSPQPNLVLNSDFGRRTVFGLAMPEVFADLSGTTKIDAGAAGSVGSNIFTQGAANNEYAWCAGSFVWRDGRASATFKATATAGSYDLHWRIDSTHYMEVGVNNGNFVLVYNIGAGRVNLATVAQALTLNRWYWIEVEKQGTTWIGKVYDTGGTVPGVTKASSTLLATLTGTQADASIAVGAHISVTSDQAAGQWGGIATGNGGVYVETWLPESMSISMTGTLGGQAVGFDESTDAGPIGKQAALRFYVPAASRKFHTGFDTTLTPPGSIAPSVAYTSSFYVKTSGASGSGLATWTVVWKDSTPSTVGSAVTVADAAEVAWTRKTVVATSHASARRANTYFDINTGATLTGTVYVALGQLERGGVATAWRNAPADDAPMTFELTQAVATTLGTSAAEIESRDLAVNVFMPWDGRIEAQFLGHIKNGTISVLHTGQLRFAALNTNSGATVSNPATATPYQMNIIGSSQVAAGKTRVSTWIWGASGTPTLDNATSGPAFLRIVCYRGK